MSSVNIFEQEKALLEGLAANDTSAVETIYRENYLMIQSFIVKNNGYPEDARDIFQEAMIVLFEKAKMSSFVLSCQIKTYLYSVCRRLWLKRLQQQSRYFPAVELLSETVPVENEIEMHNQQLANLHLLETALSKLGEPCKSILNAYYIQKRSMPHIAEIFGYTNADNAKTQKYKCLIRLKKIFFSRYKNDE